MRSKSKKEKKGCNMAEMNETPVVPLLNTIESVYEPLCGKYAVSVEQDQRNTISYLVLNYGETTSQQLTGPNASLKPFKNDFKRGKYEKMVFYLHKAVKSLSIKFQKVRSI